MKKKKSLGIKVSFLNIEEIRMGSPWSVCKLNLEGEWVPELPEGDWQDITASSPDMRYCALVRWNVEGNWPGFNVYIIDTDKQTVTANDRILGFCKDIRWEDGRFELTLRLV